MGEHPLDTPYQDEEEEELDNLRRLLSSLASICIASNKKAHSDCIPSPTPPLLTLIVQPKHTPKNDHPTRIRPTSIESRFRRILNRIVNLQSTLCPFAHMAKEGSNDQADEDGCDIDEHGEGPGEGDV